MDRSCHRPFVGHSFGAHRADCTSLQNKYGQTRVVPLHCIVGQKKQPVSLGFKRRFACHAERDKSHLEGARPLSCDLDTLDVESSDDDAFVDR